MKYKYDYRNVNFTSTQYELFKQVQELAKARLQRFIPLGDIIVYVVNNDPVIRPIYDTLNQRNH